MRQAVCSRRTAEHLAVLLLGLLVLVVHDVGYLLRQPFWFDEAWVADTTRFPLSQLPATTLSTPIGWSLLVRLLTVSGEQTARLVPLAFAGAAVMVAYWFGRKLGWQRREASVAAGILAGTAVLLVPAMLVRDDLKQYTADAFLALLVLLLTSRLDREWSRPGLAALSVVAWGGMLFGDAAAFTGAAAFAALCVIQLARRAWRRLAETAAAGAITAVLMFAVYEVFDARAVTPALVASWNFAYLPAGQGLHAALDFVSTRFRTVDAYWGLGPVWLAVPLVLAGLVTIWRLGKPGTALTIVVLWPELLVLSATKKYPFLDLRTSTFLIALTAAVAAIGVAGICSLLLSRLRGTLAAGLAALAVAGFVIYAQPYVRSRDIPSQDVRDEALYVAAHAAPGDAIVVNLFDSFDFAYYWPHGVLARRAVADVQGYEPYFPGQPDIVVALNRQPADVDAALSQALARVHGCGTIWLILTHARPADWPEWMTALHQRKLTVTQADRAGLSAIHVGGSRCQ